MLEDLAKVVTESWGQQKWSRVKGGEKQVSGAECWAKAPGRGVPQTGPPGLACRA